MISRSCVFMTLLLSSLLLHSPSPCHAAKNAGGPKAGAQNLLEDSLDLINSKRGFIRHFGPYFA